MKMNFPVSFKNHSMARLSSVQLKYQTSAYLFSFMQVSLFAPLKAMGKHLENLCVLSFFL